jgi:hypothetical protein
MSMVANFLHGALEPAVPQLYLRCSTAHRKTTSPNRAKRGLYGLHGDLQACLPVGGRTSGACTDAAMVELAQKNAKNLAAEHCFIIFLGDGFYPVNVLNTIKIVPEVCHVFCATANPTEVILAETQQRRGILGVVDGFPTKGIEGDDDIAWRKNVLRQLGYKL